jgi:hypothetical protein
MHDQWATGATEILLRPVCAEPYASSAGDDQKPNPFRHN